MRHVVLFSGGVASWAAAKRVAAAMPDDDELTLLFTDTGIEDETLYTFLREGAANVGGELEWLADGRTPWELFNDEGMIGNTRADICSRVLKRDLARKWIGDNCDPASTVVYVGMDWSEVDRYERAAPRWEPYRLEAPLLDKPWLSKEDMLEWARSEGLTPCRLYDLGFPHANCGGFCIKQGHAAFAHLLRTMPERFAEHEAAEQAFRDRSGKDVAILRDRRGGTTDPFPLSQLRRRVESDGQLALSESLDWGGCGCMVDGD